MQWLELIGGLVVAAALVLGVMRYFSVTARNALVERELERRRNEAWSADYFSQYDEKTPPEKDTSTNATK